MVDVFRNGWVLTCTIAQSIWESLGFVGQYMLLCTVAILLLLYARRLVVSKEPREVLTIAPDAPIDTADFAEFYSDLCRETGIDYTRDEALALFGWLVGNPELTEPRVLSKEDEKA